jgi:ketosteroid isomerase-like protein
LEWASNKARLEFVFIETGKGNGQPFLDLLSDETQWFIIGSTPWSGVYRGRKDILERLLGPLRARLASPMRTHALRMIGEGDLVAVQGRGENRTRDGLAYENHYCWIFTFKDGRVVSIEEYADTELFSRVLGSPRGAGP